MIYLLYIKKYQLLSVGAIWVSNINGTFENGDYITTSLIPGIGMKQNDDILRNYTVGKITMKCDFSNTNVIKKEPHKISVSETKTRNKQNKKTIIETKYIYTQTLSGTLIKTMEEESKTTVEDVYISYPIYNTSGEPIYDDFGNQKIHKVPEIETYIHTYEKYETDANGNIILYDAIDSSGNIIYETEYKIKYVKIFNDRYEIYNNESLEEEDLYLSYNFDFTQDAEHQAIINNIYRIAFVGCTYHCG